MKKIKTIKQKLFLSYTYLIVSIIIAFAVFLFGYISNIISNQTQDMMNSLLRAGINQTDMEVRKMDTISLNISYSELVKNNFEKLIHQYEPVYAANERARTIIDALMGINGPLMPVQQMNIYSLDGLVLSTGFSNRTIRTNLAKKEWYQSTLELDGKKDVMSVEHGSDVYIYHAPDKDTSYIALNRVLFNKYGQHLGILEVVTKKSQIFKSIGEIEEGSKDGIVAIIFDEEGQVIYPLNEVKEPILSYDTLRAHQNGGDEGLLKVRSDQIKYNVYYAKSNYTRWTLALIRSERSVMQPIIMLAFLMLVITSIFIGVALLLALIIARDINEPIKELLVTVRNTKFKNLEDAAGMQVDTQIAELRELDQAFRDMRINIKYSTHAMLEAQRQELKARMLALQSQMNPHFLYNTLTNISVMAEEGLNDGIVAMCEHVSFLLRYFSASKSSSVKLKEELECTKKFLGVAQIRYKDYLNYKIEVDPELEMIEVPRNILQPLVENAVKYGMDEQMRWYIHIKAYIEDEGWRIKVSDQGAGFLIEKIEELQEKIDRINIHGEYIQLEIHGMGFMNVYSRLKLTYEENMFFKFGNHPQGGAEIIIGAKIKTS